MVDVERSAQAASEPADVVIVGGGPAGASAARLLAAWGHRVVLLTRPAAQPALAESLPPSCDKLFDRIGIHRAVQSAQFLRATGNTVCWGAQGQRSEQFAVGHFGYQVERDRFDRVLLAEAAAAGAAVHGNAMVREATVQGGQGARVVYDEGGTTHTLKARWLLDCTGRAGLVARQGMRNAEPGGRTMAIAGVWEHPGRWSMDDPTHTVVESYEGGWAWSVPVSPSRRFFTVMVDPAITAIAGREHLAATYHAELQRTVRLHALTNGAVFTGEPFARDASSYAASRAADNGVLLVGDAASFVDPLSSYGVKKALASAWLAAVVAHSSLETPAHAAPALALFNSRERAMYQSLRARLAALAREAATAHAGDFWQERGEIDDAVLADEPDLAALRTDPAVLGALDELRSRPSVSLRESGSLRRIKKAIVRGNSIALEEHLAVPAFAEGVRYIRSIDLLMLVRLAPAHDQVPDLFDAYNRNAPPAPLPDFLGALAVLIGKGALLLN